VIEAQLRETPERSDQWIADDLGVDRNTVAGRRKVLAGVSKGFHEIHETSDINFEYLPKKVLYRDGRKRDHDLRKEIDREIERRETEEKERRARDEADRKARQDRGGDIAS